MAAFQFHFMVLAIDVIDRCDPSNKMHRQLQPKKVKVRPLPENSLFPISRPHANFLPIWSFIIGLNFIIFPLN